MFSPVFAICTPLMLCYFKIKFVAICLHTISVLTKCQSLKPDCEHKVTKKVLVPPLDYPRLETYRKVLPISTARP